MGKYRMYEPYGYVENNGYLGKVTQLQNELAVNRENDVKEFASVEYNETLKAFVFKNVKGEAKGYAYVTDIIPQDLIDDASYDVTAKSVVITFTNGQTVTIPLDDIIDVAEAGVGLQLTDNKFSVLVDADSEDFLSVSESGVKVRGVQDAIDAEKTRALDAENTLDEKITAETTRATNAENDIVAALRQEVSDRQANVDEEETRATAAENALDGKIDRETSDRQADVDEEETRAKGAETALDSKIDEETANRIADVNEEETRAKEEETRLLNIIGGDFSTASTETVSAKLQATNNALTLETQNRTTQDNQLQNNISNEVTARQGEITRVENLLTNEVNARIQGDSTLATQITAEETRAKGAEETLDAKIDDEIANRTTAVGEEETRAKAKETEITESLEAEVTRATAKEDEISTALDEEKTTRESEDDRVLDDILARIWNNKTHDSGATGYFKTVYNNTNGSYAQLWNESDGGGSQYFNQAANVLSYVGTNDGDANGICVQIYSKDKTSNLGSRLNINPNGMFYTTNKTNGGFDANDELVTKKTIQELLDEIQSLKDRITTLENN
jgi:hypothetical protein